MLYKDELFNSEFWMSDRFFFFENKKSYVYIFIPHFRLNLKLIRSLDVKNEMVRVPE
jgi:hypothetical protein